HSRRVKPRPAGRELLEDGHRSAVGAAPLEVHSGTVAWATVASADTDSHRRPPSRWARSSASRFGRHREPSGSAMEGTIIPTNRVGRQADADDAWPLLSPRLR